jgi:hypothetical protein
MLDTQKHILDMMHQTMDLMNTVEQILLQHNLDTQNYTMGLLSIVEFDMLVGILDMIATIVDQLCMDQGYTAICSSYYTMLWYQFH